MNGMFSFEQSPFELACKGLRKADPVDALRLLALLEGEAEDAVEEAFGTLQELGVQLQLDSLPQSQPPEQLAARLALEQKLARQGELLRNLPENDPLGLYLQELAAIPVCGDVRVLALELAESGSDAVRQRLADLSLSRVVQLAGEYTGRGVLLLDLLQEGSMGLWSCLLEYDGQEDFETVRDRCIRFSLAKAVILQARADGVGRMLQEKLDAYRRADRKLLTALGRNPTVEEIAREMGVSAEQAYFYQEQLQSAKTVSKAKPEPEPEEEDQSVENTAYFQSRQRIAELLSALSEQEAKLLQLRFGLEGGKPMSPREVGMKLGLTADEVVEKEAAALAKLRGEEREMPNA